MARIGGRNAWLAWPAGVLCAAVVVALAWLSQPILPASAAWIGQMFYSATHIPPAATPPPTVASVAGDIDCRALYPDNLWAELTWTPHVLLSQSAAAPVTTVTGLTDALAPTVRVTCQWRADGAKLIVSTLAQVSMDAVPVAEVALRGQGFACTVESGVLSCERTQGDVVEEHVVRDGLWLSSVETAWHPDAFGARLAAHVWGPAAP